MAEAVSSSDASPFPRDASRTAIILLYHEPGMIADRVLPPTPPLGSEKFDYIKFTVGDAFQVLDTDLGRKSAPHEVELEGERVTDSTRHRGLKDGVPQSDVDNAMVARGGTPNWKDPRDIAAINLKRLLRLAREVRTANSVFAAAKHPPPQHSFLAHCPVELQGGYDPRCLLSGWPG